MIAAATATLGLNEKQASGALGAAVTSIFGAALQKSNDASAMTQIASLASGVMPDAGMFSNIAGMLNGGVPSSPLQILGNRFLGQVFGGNQAGAIAALATASGISGKAASSLMTLAAPMALAAIRSKLGPAPTAASVASLLNQDRNLIAQAMPSALRTVYGLTTAAPVATAAQTSGPTSAATANPAPAASAPPTPLIAPAAAAAPIVATAASTARAAVAHTASGHASAPAAAAAPVAVAEKAATAVIAAPVVAAPVAMSAAAPEPASSGIFPSLTIMLLLGLGLMALGLLWKLSGVDGSSAAMTAKPAATATADPTQAAKPGAVTTAAKQPAGPTPMVGTPSGSGLKYTLPNNTVIEVGKNGVEQKLIAFITSASSIDKNIWFDFDRLSFETGSSDVTAASRSQIEALSAILKAYPATKVKIGGYTDNQGDAQANLKLSDSRAKRVAEELVKSGITADRVEAEGYGEQHAVGDNATPEGRAKNRRTALSVRAK